MKVLSVSEAKVKLSGLVDTVHATDEEVMITKNGRPAAVLVSPDLLESLKETVAVRSDSALMKEIKKGLRALKMKKSEALHTRGIIRGIGRSPACRDLSYQETFGNWSEPYILH